MFHNHSMETEVVRGIFFKGLFFSSYISFCQSTFFSLIKKKKVERDWSVYRWLPMGACFQLSDPTEVSPGKEDAVLGHHCSQGGYRPSWGQRELTCCAQEVRSKSQEKAPGKGSHPSPPSRTLGDELFSKAGI